MCKNEYDLDKVFSLKDLKKCEICTRKFCKDHIGECKDCKKIFCGNHRFVTSPVILDEFRCKKCLGELHDYLHTRN